jgi:hypothetical protein
MILYYIVGDNDEDARSKDVGHRKGCVMTHRIFKNELYSREGRDRLAKNHDIIVVSNLTEEHPPDRRNFDRYASRCSC